MPGRQFTRDFDLEVGRGNVPKVSYVNKFGRNPDIDTGSDPEDIWDGGGIYVPPTQARTHDIASSSAQDAGTVLSSGTATGGSLTTLIDSGATFSSDGVTAGDVVLNDTAGDHSIVVTVDSEIQLTVRAMHHVNANASGNSYRIVTSAGTGAVVVHITNALDGSWGELTEFVVLNGTSNVATANDYFRINSAHIHGAGSNKTNVGNITLTAQTDATVTAQISAGIGRTLMAFTTVPAGKTMYVTHYKSTLNRAGAIKDAQMDVSVRIRLWGDFSDGEEVLHYEGASVNGSPAENYWKPYLKVRQMTDFWIRCESVTDSDSDVTAFFDYYLVENNLN